MPVNVSAERSTSLGPVHEYAIPLDSRGRKAFIKLPTPVASRDLDRLVAWIGYMRALIDDEVDNGGSS
jgi:hypothetical protein